MSPLVKEKLCQLLKMIAMPAELKERLCNFGANNTHEFHLE